MGIDRPIILVGLMGCGKTVTGKTLSLLLGRPFFDSDAVIEYQENMSISEFFQKRGEASFRDVEKAVIEKLLMSGAGVIATGGGAFIHEDVRKMVKERGWSVWLKADVATLVQRLSGDMTRPLLQGGDIEERLRQLMVARASFYSQADAVIDTDSKTPQTVAREIGAMFDNSCLRHVG